MTDRHQKPSYPLRMPDELRSIIKARATRNRRSMNAEIVLMLESALQKESAPTVAAVEAHVSETIR